MTKENEKLQHTPGPWVVEHSRLEKTPGVVAGLEPIALIVKSEANASLIAAAPELLEALKGVLSESFDIECGDRVIVAQHVDAIRDVIAKAEGH